MRVHVQGVDGQIVRCLISSFIFIYEGVGGCGRKCLNA